MAGVTVTISGGVTDTLYGNYQAPIKALIEQTAGVSDNDSNLKRLFKTIEGNDDYKVAFGGITALRDFAPRGEKEPHAVDDFQETPPKDIKYFSWGKKLEISKELLKFNKADLRNYVSQFTASYYVSRENFATRFYGEATQGHSSFNIDKYKFDTTTADKQPLFSTAHPSSVKPSKTQSNAFSNAFSAEALGLAETAAHKFEGDTGNRLGIEMDTILIPDNAALAQTVFGVLGAYASPNDSANAFNWQFGRWKVWKLKYLDKFIAPGTQPWILLDSRYLDAANGAVFGDWDGLQVRSEYDSETCANIWYADAAYNAAFIDWRFACCGGIPGATVLS
jgi:predicted regulator of Ras-like GTPase activity (Roadblock/LC7/MglB family)